MMTIKDALERLKDQPESEFIKELKTLTSDLILALDQNDHAHIIPPNEQNLKALEPQWPTLEGRLENPIKTDEEAKEQLKAMGSPRSSEYTQKVRQLYQNRL